jgi:hypothetical protein
LESFSLFYAFQRPHAALSTGPFNYFPGTNLLDELFLAEKNNPFSGAAQQQVRVCKSARLIKSAAYSKERALFVEKHHREIFPLRH